MRKGAQAHIGCSPTLSRVPKISRQTHFLCLFQINRFNNPTSPGPPGNPSPKRWALRTFPGKGGGYRWLSCPSRCLTARPSCPADALRGACVGESRAWTRGAAPEGALPSSRRPQHPLWRQISQTHSFPRPCLCPDSAARLGESERNTCGRLKMIGKTHSEHFGWAPGQMCRLQCPWLMPQCLCVCVGGCGHPSQSRRELPG